MTSVLPVLVPAFSPSLLSFVVFKAIVIISVSYCLPDQLI